MLYDSQRIKWWRKRSSSREYQVAYANIVRIIHGVGGTLVDVGCGNGRLMKKALPYFDKIIGTDTSDEMIFLTNKKTNKNPKVELVKDNILFSKLESEIADTTTLTFPELSFAGEYNEDDKKFDEKLLEFYFSILPDSRNLSDEQTTRIIFEFRRDYNLARITKTGGYFISAEYDTFCSNDGEDPRLEFYSFAYRNFGLELELARYFESPAIFSDIEDSRDSEEGLKKGYSVMAFKKFEHKLL